MTFIPSEDDHPIKECPELPLERRVQILEHYLACVWDHVWWWLHLSPEKRAEYEREGFKPPIEKFYGKGA